MSLNRHTSVAVMLTRTLRQIFVPRLQQNIILPPTYLLPFRASFSTSAPKGQPNLPPTLYQPLPLPSHSTPQLSSSANQSTRSISREPLHDQLNSAFSNSPHSSSSLNLLPILAAQPPHYIIVRIHQRPYLLTHGDSLRLPFHLKDAPPGTILRLVRASALGSRDYTFRGKPLVDEKYFVCRVQVIGIEGEPMRVMEKTMRRQRHIKRVKSKMRYTVVRCIELRVLTDAQAEPQAVDNIHGIKISELQLAPEQ